MNSMNSRVIIQRTKLSAFRILWIPMCLCIPMLMLVRVHNISRVRKPRGRSLLSEDGNGLANQIKRKKLSFEDGFGPSYEKVKEIVQTLLKRNPSRLFDQLHMSFKKLWDKYPKYHKELVKQNRKSRLPKEAMENFLYNFTEGGEMRNSCGVIARITKFILEDYCEIKTHTVAYMGVPKRTGDFHFFNLIVPQEIQPDEDLDIMMVDIQGAIRNGIVMPEWDHETKIYCPKSDDFAYFNIFDKKMFTYVTKAEHSSIGHDCLDSLYKDQEALLLLKSYMQILHEWQISDEVQKGVNDAKLSVGDSEGGMSFEIWNTVHYENFKDRFFVRVEPFARFVMREFERLTLLPADEFQKERNKIAETHGPVFNEDSVLRNAVSGGSPVQTKSCEPYFDENTGMIIYPGHEI